MRRPTLDDDDGDGGSYFAAPKRHVNFISTGSFMLDLALGGGWAESRIANIIGDKSTGKTLLMIEAAANFCAKYPEGVVRYRECEAAFDPSYAEALGMPIKRVDFGKKRFETVEDVAVDIENVIDKAKGPELYIVDSLDALSDKAELARKIDEPSYGTKAKKVGEIFRRDVRKMHDTKVTFLIVSQVRDRIGATFGRKWTRSGGRSLDFYASQIIYLAHIGQVSKTISGVKRAIGVDVKAKVEKNKVGNPFREAEFQIRFGYGIDDALSCLMWLRSVKELDGLVDDTSEKEVMKEARRIMSLPRGEYDARMRKIRKRAEKKWYEIEQSFLPKRSKYG